MHCHYSNTGQRRHAHSRKYMSIHANAQIPRSPTHRQHRHGFCSAPLLFTMCCLCCHSHSFLQLISSSLLIAGFHNCSLLSAFPHCLYLFLSLCLSISSLHIGAHCVLRPNTAIIFIISLLFYNTICQSINSSLSFFAMLSSYVFWAFSPSCRLDRSRFPTHDNTHSITVAPGIVIIPVLPFVRHCILHCHFSLLCVSDCRFSLMFVLLSFCFLSLSLSSAPCSSLFSSSSFSAPSSSL